MINPHGGDIYQNKVQEREWLDFSANINLLGMPREVEQAAIEGILLSCHYPDVQKRELLEQLERKMKINRENIVLGNGAAELLYGFSFACQPKRALLLAPTFAEYEKALKASGCMVEKIFLRREKKFLVDKLEQQELLEKLPGADAVILCNPNNPTGQLFPERYMRELAATCRKEKTRLMIDECFLPFTTEGISYLKEIEENSYLCILRAFTKLYAMPGLRLGYLATADTWLKQRLEEVLQPWNVSLPAQKAGVAALNRLDYAEKTREALSQQRSYLLEKLAGCNPVIRKIYGAEANYIFFEAVEELGEELKRKGILIRDCSNYEGLRRGDFRICIRTREENNRLLEAIGLLCRELSRTAGIESKWQT